MEADEAEAAAQPDASWTTPWPAAALEALKLEAPNEAPIWFTDLEAQYSSDAHKVSPHPACSRVQAALPMSPVTACAEAWRANCNMRAQGAVWRANGVRGR